MEVSLCTKDLLGISHMSGNKFSASKTHNRHCASHRHVNFSDLRMKCKRKMVAQRSKHQVSSSSQWELTGSMQYLPLHTVPQPHPLLCLYRRSQFITVLIHNFLGTKEFTNLPFNLIFLPHLLLPIP